MKYKNPVLPGMYPDPSVCCVDEIYYLVNSTFEYMPGIPVFKSTDLVNWTQIGNCLTDPRIIGLEECPCSGGIFASTIRWHNGRFYVITTCFGKNGMKNFFITAEDPAGPWSEPIFIDIKGIDPSIYWEGGKTYVQYTEFGTISQVEIEESDGSITNGPHAITTGCGGRDAEGPHIWKRNDYYYLLLAEGGTREGHMVTLMRSRSIWGPFEPSPYLPVVSNKDYSREPLQCVGHADWVADEKGNDYLIALASRHVKHKTILGRETVLTPAYWTEDGWLRAKTPFMPVEAETAFAGIQEKKVSFCMDMGQDRLPMNIISPRKRHDELVSFQDGRMSVTGNRRTLSEEADPVLLAVRQAEYQFGFKTEVVFQPDLESEEAGLAVYADAEHHFSLFLTRRNGQNCVVFRKQVDDMRTESVFRIGVQTGSVRLYVAGDEKAYRFGFYTNDGNEVEAGWTYNKHLSNSCSNSPNTGVIVGIYVIGSRTACFKQFEYQV